MESASTPTSPRLERHHVIVGGGFSGLYLAWKLRRAGVWVRLYEAARFGGLIQTRKTPYGLNETAANGFIAGPLLDELVRDLELELLTPKDTAKARYFRLASGFRRWPLGPLETAGFVLRAGWTYLRRKAAPRAGESVYDWGRRVLGGAAADRLLRPATQGIYASPADALSAPLILGRFFDKKKSPRRPRSKLKGTVSFRHGMGELITKLVERLNDDPGVTLVQKRVGPEDLANFRQESAVQKVWLAVPSHVAAQLLAASEPKLARALTLVPRVPVLTVTAFFPPHPSDRQGFGYLNHPALGRDVMGVLWNDRIFEGRSIDDLRSETWILQGEGPTRLIDAPDEAVLDVIRRTREEDTGHRPRLIHAEIQRWPTGLPRYDSNLEKIQGEFQKEWGKVRLVGNYVAGIGLTRIMEWIDAQVEGLST